MRVFVIGSGNWGTVLASLFAGKNEVYLWTINEEEAELIRRTHESPSLPGFKIPLSITIEKKFTQAVQPDDIVIVAIPSRKMEELVIEFKNTGNHNFIFVNASKGVEHTTLRTNYETVRMHLPEVRFANLSGPTIARELAEGLPAKAVLASSDVSLLLHLQEILDNELLKFDFSRDVVGSELAAAMKGLIAIGVGISDGLGFKTNIFGLIITYGLREFETVMKFLKVPTQTVYGIAGIGDLITTCISENSRNRTFGKYLAQGYKLEEALKEVGMEVEGVSMAKTIRRMAQFNLSIPLVSCLTKIIFDGVEDIRKELLETLNNISG
ncbi:MAG: NAD(P)H-dependent glycerol-3-phosphate dehydrogenase [Candidatus Cloacimonetes bacterium]|nr:NAD(P)H-dependent glycerol-3-phosphate dehydrogenase [Candidatus Cloacimonadota bacterium]